MRQQFDWGELPDWPIFPTNSGRAAGQDNGIESGHYPLQDGRRRGTGRVYRLQTQKGLEKIAAREKHWPLSDQMGRRICELWPPSSLLNYWYKAHFPNVNINPNNFRQLPIRAIDFADPPQVRLHDAIVKLVEQFLELHVQLASAPSEAEREIYQRQVEALDREVDKAVYELYGLGKEEIRMVEEEL